MRSLVTWILVGGCGFWPQWIVPQTFAAEPAVEIRIASLIQRLGHESYEQRTSADQELASLGFESRRQLEHATKSENPEIRLRATELVRKLRVKSLWSGGQVTLKLDGEPASTALSTLLEQTGNRVIRGDTFSPFKDEKVQLATSAGPFWPTLDELCRQSGNHVRPHYDPREAGLVIVGGAPGKNPVAYAGPLRAQITTARRVFIEEFDYEEGKAEITHTLQLNLQMMWEDRLQLVAHRSQPEIAEAITDNGVKLFPLATATNGWNVTGNGARQLTAGLRLSPAPAAAKKLSRLTLKWGLIALGELSALDVGVQDRGAHRQDDLELQIEDFEDRQNGRCDVTLNVSRDLVMPDPQEILFRENQIELFDAEGEAWRGQGQTNQLTERGVRYKISFSSEKNTARPKTIRVTYPRLRSQQDMEIVFKDVPLPTARPE